MTNRIWHIKILIGIFIGVYISSAYSIVNGVNASRGEYPEYVQLWADGAFVGQDENYVYSLCGGTLLTSTKVLTAAHCTHGISENQLYVQPNFYSFNDTFSFKDLLTVSKIEEHPSFREDNLAFDIAIITLSQPYIGDTALIYGGQMQFDNFPATVIGTGVYNVLSESSPNLRKTTITTVGNEECEINKFDNLFNDVICAGSYIAYTGPCNGDSGSALHTTIHGSRTQIGIVSGGQLEICAPDVLQFDFYTRLSTAVDFLKSKAPDTKFIYGDSGGNLAPIINLLLFN